MPIKHGHNRKGESRSKTYNTWINLKPKCYNIEHKYYRNYGGKGVIVCDRWKGKEGFIHFLEDMGERPEGKVLIRVNSSGNYCPENCKWGLKKEQPSIRKERANQEREHIRNQKFGKLTALENLGRRAEDGKVEWRCKCDCGNETIVTEKNLKNGNSTSCGCVRLEKATKHKHCIHKGHSVTYRTWQGIKQRCNNPNCEEYHNYGGRGIKICDEWNAPDGFVIFLRDMGEKPKGKSIDRIDNNGNYCKENCRWATHKEQCNNTRRNKYYTFHGIIKTLNQWADTVNIPKDILQSRVSHWGAIDKVIDFPWKRCIKKK